jgi:hypothetical protein
MKLIVLSNKAQYNTVVQSGSPPKDYQVICDNPKFFDFLRKKDVSFEELNIFAIQNRWREINKWSCDRASMWLTQCQESKSFTFMDCASHMHHNFSYILVQTLRQYFSAKHLIEHYKPTQVAIFTEVPRSSFPDVSSSLMLNAFLSQLCREQGIETIKLKIQAHDLKSSQTRRHGFKDFCRTVVQSVYGFLVRPSKQVDILLVGTVRHLAETIQELRRRNAKLVYYDFNFRLDKFLFSIRKGVHYVVPTCFSRTRRIDAAEFKSISLGEVRQTLERTTKSQLFKFEDHDFGPFLIEHVLTPDYLEPHFERLSRLSNHWENVVHQCEVSTLLLDADISHENSFIGAYLKPKGIRVVALSHANFPVDFTVERQNRSFALSTTFVHSEFEKYGYQCRGWNPNQLMVTGTPKYDKLFQNSKRASHQKRSPDVMQIFYCAGSLFLRLPPHRGSYIGHTMPSVWDVQTPSLETLLRVTKHMPVHIVFKSRAVADGPEWQNFVRKNDASDQISITDPNADIFELIEGCDVMVLAQWSTAIQEAAMLGKQSLLIDLFGSYQHFVTEPTVGPFFQNGFCTILAGEAAVKRGIQTTYDQFLHGNAKLKPVSEDVRNFYLGPNDGGNTKRIVDHILASQNVPTKKASPILNLEHVKS